MQKLVIMNINVYLCIQYEENHLSIATDATDGRLL